MPFEINLILTWYDKCVLSNDTKAKLYVPVVTLLLLKQLKSGFKITINWNKYQPKITTQTQNSYLDFLIEPIFRGVNRLFVLLFENKEDRRVSIKFYLPKAEIKNYNAMIDRKNLFDQPVTNNLKTYDNIGKFATGQGDDYTTGCLSDYNYFNNYDKMIAIYLSKQQALDADPKAMQQINFTGNLALEVNANTTMFFIIEEAKETILDFSQGTVKVL